MSENQRKKLRKGMENKKIYYSHKKVKLNLRVLVKEPTLSFNPSNFTQSMNIVGKIKINGVYANDLYDKVMVSTYGNTVFNESRYCFWCPKVMPICDMGLFVELVAKEKDVEGVFNLLLSENLVVEKEKELILKALKKHKGKRKDAALDLGISERTLYRKLKEYDIEE